MKFAAAMVAVGLFTPSLDAQVPDGWYVYGAFAPQRGRVGLFMSHPRNPGPPTVIDGIVGDLAISGSSSCSYRHHDGVLIVGERAPLDHSVDLHLITLAGTRVWYDQLISVGVSDGIGEIPQAASLTDGRIVVAATALLRGPLATVPTTSYGLEGIGIVDPLSGVVAPIAIDNPPALLTGGVFNALAVSPDEQTVYVGTWYAAMQGDIWALPLPDGGTPTLVASVPSGISNMAFDANGELWVTGLDPTIGTLFRVDVTTGGVVTVSHLNGTLNAIAPERATAGFALVSANAGTPPRSVFHFDPGGSALMLTNPGLGTISGIDVNPSPQSFGEGTPGVASHGWRDAPNPGGLPTEGNLGFSLTLDSNGPIPSASVVLFCLARLPAAVPVLGLDVWVDPGTAIATMALPGAASTTVPLGIPAGAGLTGLELFVQSIHLEGGTGLAASDGVTFTVL